MCTLAFFVLLLLPAMRLTGTVRYVEPPRPVLEPIGEITVSPAPHVATEEIQTYTDAGVTYYKCASTLACSWPSTCGSRVALQRKT